MAYLFKSFKFFDEKAFFPCLFTWQEKGSLIEILFFEAIDEFWTIYVPGPTSSLV
jgi:hypothetical protein